MATTVHCFHYQDHRSDKIWGWVTQTGTPNAFVFWGRTPGARRAFGSGTLQWQEKPFPEAARRGIEKTTAGYQICRALEGEVLAQFHQRFGFRHRAAAEVRAALRPAPAPGPMPPPPPPRPARPQRPAPAPAPRPRPTRLPAGMGADDLEM